MQTLQIIAILAIAGILATHVQADTTLAKNGKSPYVIVVSKDASPSEKHAAHELAQYIAQISGVELPVIIDRVPASQRMVLVGDSQTLRSLKPGIDFEALGDEGFAIKTVGPHLVIAGGRLRGTMYGVYTFLEDLGCRWYSSKVTSIPKKPTITLPPLNIVQKPDFEYREPFYTDAFDADWAARNKCNSNSARLDADRGGKVSYGKFVHTFAELFPPAKYYRDHPEYFSLVDGKRQDGYAQICMSNPEVLRIATDTVMQWIAENPDARIFSVSQNDAGLNCQCDVCKAIDAEEGSPSGLLLRFVNAVAEEVEKKYPNVLIDTLAYQWTEKPPKITKPRANVRVRLCPIGACEFHDYETCPNNKSIVDNLREWNKVTDNLYIWHYNTDFGHYMMPWPDLDELGTSIPLYKRSGVKGMFTQGNYSAGGGGWMDELKAYMIAKMLWNTKVDQKTVIAEFLNGYYGKAGAAGASIPDRRDKPIGQFLDLLQNKVKTGNIHGGIYIDIYAPYMTNEVIAEGRRLFDEAQKLADGPEVLERVKHARLSVDYVPLMREALAMGANGTPEQKAATLKKLEAFIAECKADGITNLDEGRKIDQTFEAYAKNLR
ncbi:MAG TPA: DUF4838 domain-containing protein [Armatimonadota bacterium]|nr:DUF4838 domain-containing protein [Armatimonadota bacterium]